jgi:hypothetical protein
MQTLSISTIFKKGEDGKYSNEARLYQYILKYPILNGEQSMNSKDNSREIKVSSWEIMIWLIKALPEFKLKYSNDNISKTIPKIRRRIMRRLHDLVKLELLSEEKVRQKKSDGTTDSFRFTIFGKLLGWIIKSIDFDNSIVHDNNTTINDRELINKQIFNLLQQIFKTGPYSPTIDVLASDFISKCKQLNRFGNIVNVLKSTLNDKEILIDDISDLLNCITTCNFKDQNSKVIFTSLWNKTIIELEPKVKNVVFYNLKLEFEQDMQNHVKAYQPYEKWWFDYKSDHRVVAIECSCTNCDNYTPAVVGLMEYKERKFYSKIDLKNLTILSLNIYNKRSFSNIRPCELSAKCKACGKGSLRLSFPN